jgi:uncharacterized membrane protein HdeD (DUF308 family)
MVVVGVAFLITGFVADIAILNLAIFVCLGCFLSIFGIVEIIRSKNIRQRKAKARESEFDAYVRIAAEMGVVVNPITHEVVKKNDGSDEVKAEAAE